MESSNFDLNQSIANYVNLISAQGSLTGSDKNELVSHLQDSTGALQSKGLSEEEAFIIASKRIGNAELLTEEYSKVNFSLKSNKVWAYLVVGFNILCGLPSVFILLLSAVYFIVHKQYGTSTLAVAIVTALHLIIIIGIWSVSKYKQRISRYIERQVDQKPIRFIILTCMPLIITMTFSNMLARSMPGMSVNYPIYKFDSGLTEFTLYLAALSIIGLFLTLTFSINHASGKTVKALFQKPSFMFLFLFGITIEFLAASTRGLRIDNMVIESLLFAAVYGSASFLIAFYNKNSSVNKYLLMAMLLGLILEVSVGISADLGRGNTYFTAYYASALIGGVALGRYLGLRFSPDQEMAGLESDPS
jgi:hypothetical protein